MHNNTVLMITSVYIENIVHNAFPRYKFRSKLLHMKKGRTVNIKKFAIYVPAYPHVKSY